MKNAILFRKLFRPTVKKNFIFFLDYILLEQFMRTVTFLFYRKRFMEILQARLWFKKVLFASKMCKIVIAK